MSAVSESITYESCSQGRYANADRFDDFVEPVVKVWGTEKLDPPQVGSNDNLVFSHIVAAKELTLHSPMEVFTNHVTLDSYARIFDTSASPVQIVKLAEMPLSPLVNPSAAGAIVARA